MIGHLTLVEIEDGVGPSYVALPGVMEITPPPLATGSVDNTDLQAAAYTKTFEPGMVDGGEVTLTVKYTGAVHARLAALLRTTKNYRLTFPDSSTVIFPAFPTKLEGPKVKSEDLMVMEVGLKVASAVTFSP